MRGRRAFLIVLDSVGCGAMPDADRYGDVGTDTLGHVAAAVGGLALPVMGRLGLGCAHAVAGVECETSPKGLFGSMAERSVGKDTTTGHWELMGLPVLEPFPTYPQGFPAELMARFTELTGYGWLGNMPASGTEIIERLGAEHLSTGKLIVYTSADSVFQIAAHEDIVSVNELYRVCEIARKSVLIGEHAVARVIARPFAGDAATGFVRTPRRHDYSVIPWSPTALDVLRSGGIPTYAVGKISDIFAGRGVTLSRPTTSNDHGMDEVLNLASSINNGLVFANLVDFDMAWGHRRDSVAYARGLERADQRIGELIEVLRPDDLLIITADHGCDPTHRGSDHTREYVPLLVTTGATLRDGTRGENLGVRATFADVAATVLSWFGLASGSTNVATDGYSWAGECVLAGTDLDMPYHPVRFALPEQVKAAQNLLEPHLADGERLFLVGGLLRDSILGNVAVSPDVDIVLVGDIDRLLTRVAESDSSEVAVRNETLRTAHIRSVDGIVEIDLAEARAESYGCNSAYPERTVAVSIEWDLARRDFTVNALALPLDVLSEAHDFSTSDLVDLFGGVADVRAGVLRVLHEESFQDDPTRVLRALRFAHRFGFSIEPHSADLASSAVAEGAMDRVAEAQMSRELKLLANEWKG